MIKQDDFSWYSCGDYISYNGDFETTGSSGYPFSAYELQETISRLKASDFEFLMDSNEIACNIEQWLGKELTEDNAKALVERILHAFNYYSFLHYESKLEVRYLKLNNTTLGIYLKLTNPSYDPIYLNVYIDYSSGNSSVFVEETTDNVYK